MTSVRRRPQPVSPLGIPILGEFFMEFIADPAAFEPDRFSWKQMQKGGLIKGRLPDGEERILAYIIEREPQEIPHAATTMLQARTARRRVGSSFV